MQPYVRVLRQRVRESRYAIVERSVAEAILVRGRLRRAVARPELQTEPAPPPPILALPAELASQPLRSGSALL